LFCHLQIFCNADTTSEALKITNSATVGMNPLAMSIDMGEKVDDFEMILLNREKNESMATIQVKREKSMERFLRLEKIIHGDINDYNIPAGIITPRVAAELIEIFKRGGRLSKSSMHKLLRYSYRKLKDLPNVSRPHIGYEERLVVVGDLHGAL